MELRESTEQEFIKAKINALQIAGEWIPGIKILQSLRPSQNLFMCSRGLKQYGLSEAFFRHLPVKEYRNLIFNPDDVQTCLLGVREYGDQELNSKKFYIRHSNLPDGLELELIIVHFLLPEQTGRARFTFTQIIPLNFQPWAAPKIVRIAKEMAFRKENDNKYAELTERNKEVLSLMARCFTAEEIGKTLHIETNTVNSHKKRIKEVLETNSNWDLMQYAFAYDLQLSIEKMA